MSCSIYQINNGKFKADVQVNGCRKTKTFAKKSDAVKWAKEFERDVVLNAQSVQAISAPVFLSLHEALSRYAQEVSVKKITGRKEQELIARLQKQLPNVEWPLERYQGAFIEQWQNQVMNRVHRPLKANSVLRVYSTLSDFFNWCIRKKWIVANPMKDIEHKPTAGEHRERRIELEELQSILRELDYDVGNVPITKNQQVGLIFVIALATGMRSGEIVNRLVSEVDLERRIVIIPTTKNGTRRIVPLDNFALFLWRLALERERNGERVFSVSDSSRDALFRKARDKAGLKGLTFHDSRHESASLMAKRLANPLTLCKVFGWKDVNRALTYYNPTPSEIASELNQSQGLDVLFKSA